MARRRMIDPNIWVSEDVSKLTMLERLLLIGMFSNADDYGKGRANTSYLRSTIFTYDDIRIQEISDGLDHISKYINITFYEIDGSSYYKFTNWNKWQTVQKPQESKIPDPLDNKEQVENNSLLIPESVENESSLREEKRREENIKEEKENTHSLDTQSLELCKYYETLKPMQSITSELAALKIFIEQYSFDWTKEAIQMSVSKKGKFIKPWIETVLKNWTIEGKEPNKGGNNRDAPRGNSESNTSKHKIKVNRDMPDVSQFDKSEFGEL